MKSGFEKGWRSRERSWGFLNREKLQHSGKQAAFADSHAPSRTLAVVNWLAMFAVLLLLAVPAFAQILTTATINGTAVDATGAVIPDATVVITNQGTKVAAHTQTNGDGSFVAPGLTVGTYSVSFQMAGFQSYTATGLVLHPGIITTINPTLLPGGVTASVSVHAINAEIETSQPALSSQISDEQAQTLPLNGRNYQSLSVLMPGATNTSPGGSLNGGGFLTTNVLSLNGMGSTGTMYYLDGIWNENSGSMGKTTITPNPDTIEEVRALQNNYGVQYSLNGASVVLLQTKSGTSTFHGAAFEYLRNNDLDARNYFSPTVSPLHQNIFGFNVGGPIYIPHYYNTDKTKLFFFFSQQWYRQLAGQTLIGATPTADMRKGLFSGTIKDPTTGQPFPVNSNGQTQIPQADLNSGSLALANALLPLPNNPAGGFNNFINQIALSNDQSDNEIKVNYNFSDRFHLMAEFLQSTQTVLYPNESVLLSPFSTIRTIHRTPNKLAQVQLTQIYSPSMVNTTSISMNRYIDTLIDTGTTTETQVPGFSETLPYFSAAGLLPHVTISQGWSTFGISPSVPQLPGGNNLEDSISDNGSLLRGHHYIQAGMQLVFGTKRQTSVFAATNGLWNFSGFATGNSMADFLMGYAASLSQGSSRPRYALHYIIASPYVEDSWKAMRNLTLTGGLRYEYMPNLHSQNQFESVFVPSQYSASEAPIVSTKGTITPTSNYNPLNGLVINGENGIPVNFSNAHKNYLAPSVGFAWDVFGNGSTSLRGGYGITYYTILPSSGAKSAATNPPFVQTISLTTPRFPDSLGGKVAPIGAPSINSEDITNLRDPMIQTYSLSLQHEFPGGWLASIAGAGDLAQRLPKALNINQPVPDSPYDYNPVINAGTTFTYLYSPYLGYAAISQESYEDYANWQALEFNLRHPIGHDLFVSVAYTWQHGLTNNFGGAGIFNVPTNVQNIYNLKSEYGNSPVNVPQILAISAIWSVPWLKGANGWTERLLGNWKLSDITSIQSGFSLTPGISTSTRGLATRPNRTSQPISGPKTVANWFNTAAFTAPAAGYFGNATPGSITGPGLINFDLAAHKDFPITEQQGFEFRAEFFNAFNHTNFSSVSTALGAGDFGSVTSADDPRILEGVLRYHF